MKHGDAAIHHLAERAEAEDPAASSHWRQYHADFRYTGAGFTGLDGFGGAHSTSFPRRILHRILQRPYRRMAQGFPDFPRLDALAERVTKAETREYDLDVLRQAISLAMLRQAVPDRLTGKSRALVIGDGFGTMTALLIESGSAGQVILVNLTKTLLVDLWYLRALLGPEAFQTQVGLAEPGDDPGTLGADSGLRVIALRADQHEGLRGLSANLAINIASMQEMNPEHIHGYFTDMRAMSALTPDRLAFYCCNREEKILPDGTKVRMDEYPWKAGDDVLFESPCPWHQKYYAARPPFYLPYDGRIDHKLVVFAADN